MTDSILSPSVSHSLMIPKLRDDGSNWADYEPRAKTAMGSKGLAGHLSGRIKKPMPLIEVNGVPQNSAGTDATEVEIDAREDKISEYEKREYLARHLITSSTSPRLSQKLLKLANAKLMWDAVKIDATNKSILHQVDARTQLHNMRCGSSSDPKAHLLELKAHFALMTERFENLRLTSKPVDDDSYVSIIIQSMPIEMYGPTIQTIDTTTKLTSKTIEYDLLMSIFLQEAEHRVIGQEKAGESAMLASQKGSGARRTKKKAPVCFNCERPGHLKATCFSPGGGMEGQGPNQLKAKKKAETANLAKTSEPEELFAFECTSDFKEFTSDNQPSSDVILDSGASRHFCPDKTKFENYRSITNDIRTADGRTFKAIGMGNVRVELPNGNSSVPVMLKDCVYSPELAFTLLSIS
jgi:hypothetical protein